MERDDVEYSSDTDLQMVMPPFDEQPKFELTALDRELHELIRQGIDFSPDSLERRKLRNELVKQIQKAGVLYRPTAEEKPFYADALSTMWRYFFTHLWESERHRPFSQPGYWVIGRLNRRLKGELKDLRSKAAKQEQARQQPKSIDGEWINPVDQVPALPVSELPPLETALLNWLNTDEGIQQICIRGRSQITGAIVIRRKLLDDVTWKTIAAELGCSIPTLSAFYERECRLRLQQFCKDYGYRE